MNLHPGIGSVFDGVERVGDHVEYGPRDALGVEDDAGEIRGGRPADCDPCIRSPLLDGLHDVGDEGHEVGGHRIGLPFLAEGKHVHHERRDLPLVAAHDVPALAHHREIVIFQAHVDEIAASLDALEDVLDVV